MRILNPGMPQVYAFRPRKMEPQIRTDKR